MVTEAESEPEAEHERQHNDERHETDRQTPAPARRGPSLAVLEDVRRRFVSSSLRAEKSLLQSEGA